MDERRAREAAERLVQKQAEDIRHLIKEQKLIKQIQHYDQQVRKVIASSEMLQQAWDDFAVLYQLTADEAILETMKEKIRGDLDGKCYACERIMPGDSEVDQDAYKRLIKRANMLEHRLRALGEEV